MAVRQTGASPVTRFAVTGAVSSFSENSFDLIDLRLIVDIADKGSLSRAASAFPIAVSAASNRLRKVECEAGYALFNRSAEGMSPTPAGRLVIERARNVLVEASALHGMLSRTVDARATRIKIAVSGAFMCTGLTKLFARFLLDFPEADLQFSLHDQVEVQRLVGSGEVELGILDRQSFQSGLEYAHLLSAPLHLLASITHRYAKTGTASLRDMLSEPIVSLGSEFEIRSFLEAAATRYGLPLRVRAEAADPNTLVTLVAQGVGVTLLPDFMLPMLGGDQLCVDIPLLPRSYNLYSCSLAWRDMSPYSRQLLSCLTNRYDDADFDRDEP